MEFKAGGMTDSMIATSELDPEERIELARFIEWVNVSVGDPNWRPGPNWVWSVYRDQGTGDLTVSVYAASRLQGRYVRRGSDGSWWNEENDVRRFPDGTFLIGFES